MDVAINQARSNKIDKNQERSKTRISVYTQFSRCFRMNLSYLWEKELFSAVIFLNCNVHSK